MQPILRTVTESARGQRLDRYLHAELPAHSRAFLQKLIRQGRVLVNARPGKPGYRLRTGDKITVEIPPPCPPGIEPEPIPLEVLHEDNDLIVLNKPAGMVVHPAAGHRSGTLVNALLHHCRGKLSGIGGVERAGIVHRLDKGTSGCIVVAKTDAAHRSLVAQFKDRSVKKIYRALCAGRFQQPSGTIETTIGRSTRHRKKMSATARRGRVALTDYRLLAQFDRFALVELIPRTGRTHQLRVHMAHIGHPVVGDKTYGRKFENSVERPMLHAYKLGFTHPATQRYVEFTAPMPAEMVKLCAS